MSARAARAKARQPARKAGERQVASARWIGLALIAGGGAAIAFGWSGMARVNCADCQLPYLLSGGAAGLALVMVGAALFVIAQLRSDRLRLEASLAELASALAPGPPVMAPDAGQEGAGGPELMVAGRSSFHRQSCRLVQGKAATELISYENAVARGLTACRICQPVGTVPEGAAPEIASGNGRDPAAELEPGSQVEEAATQDTATALTKHPQGRAAGRWRKKKTV